MCGRFAFYSPHEAIVRLFAVEGVAIQPRYNLTPTQFVPVLRRRTDGTRRLDLLYWGLVPQWAKDKKIGGQMINARLESLADKPSFRMAYKRRRCLVLADGYYEWRAGPDGKQPYFIHRSDQQPFAMAGLWESWRDPASVTDPHAVPLESCAIVTSEAAPSVAAIHNRMPAIVSPDHYDVWMDVTQQDTTHLPNLLDEPVRAQMMATRVSKRVNNPRNDGPDLIEAASVDGGM
jgi:putative SOS response-associated peptidase YedK